MLRIYFILVFFTHIHRAITSIHEQCRTYYNTIKKNYNSDKMNSLKQQNNIFYYGDFVMHADRDPTRTSL